MQNVTGLGFYCIITDCEGEERVCESLADAISRVHWEVGGAPGAVAHGGLFLLPAHVASKPGIEGTYCQTSGPGELLRNAGLRGFFCTRCFIWSEAWAGLPRIWIFNRFA